MFKKLIALITMYINARLDNDTATANVLARFIDIELEKNKSKGKINGTTKDSHKV